MDNDDKDDPDFPSIKLEDAESPLQGALNGFVIGIIMLQIVVLTYIFGTMLVRQ